MGDFSADYPTEEFGRKWKNVFDDEIDIIKMCTMAKQSMSNWLISVNNIIPFSCDEGVNVILSHDGVGKTPAKPPPSPKAAPGTRPLVADY